MTEQHCVDALLAEFRSNRPLRANSLIITVYGDAIAPHGGGVWLGSLIKILEPFGLNQRLVRTSVFRLAKENWLTSEQIGRRSYYSLTGSGRRRFEHAYRRIYALPPHAWDGRWCLVFAHLPGLEAELRDTLKRELEWQGFGSPAPGVLAHPNLPAVDVAETLRDLGVQDKTVVMTATALNTPAEQPLQALVRQCWDLDKLGRAYKRFLERFRPVWRALQDSDELDPERCFQARTLLIHEYRRVLLRDPHLPDELLPPDWPGVAARLLCRNLYRRVQAPAERYLLETLETADGPLPEAAAYYYTRFGGLADVGVRSDVN